MQETWVPSLIREDPTCCGATKPQLLSLCSRTREPQLLSLPHTTVSGRETPSRARNWALTLGNALFEETHANKARDFIGKGHPGGEQEGKGTQENCSALWLEVLGFMVMELVSR